MNAYRWVLPTATFTHCQCSSSNSHLLFTGSYPPQKCTTDLLYGRRLAATNEACAEPTHGLYQLPLLSTHFSTYYCWQQLTRVSCLTCCTWQMEAELKQIIAERGRVSLMSETASSAHSRDTQEFLLSLLCLCIFLAFLVTSRWRWQGHVTSFQNTHPSHHVITDYSTR